MPNPHFATPTCDSPPRFSLRMLLAVMSAAAALAAVAGPIYRHTVPAAQDELLVFWSAALAVGSAVAWRRWRAGHRVASAAGSINFILPRPDCPSFFWTPLSLLWFLLLLVPSAAFCDISIHVASGDWRGPLMSGALLSAVICFAGGKLVEPLTRRRALRLCDRGLIAADRLTDWKDVRSASWGGPDGDWLIFSAGGRAYAANVPREHRISVERFLAQKSVDADTGQDAGLSNSPLPAHAEKAV